MVICFRENEVHVIQQICYCVNTEEYAKRINKKERKQNHVIEI